MYQSNLVSHKRFSSFHGPIFDPKLWLLSVSMWVYSGFSRFLSPKRHKKYFDLCFTFPSVQ